MFSFVHISKTAGASPRQRPNVGRRGFTVTPADLVAIAEANRLDLSIHEWVRQAGREGCWKWRIPDVPRPSAPQVWFGRS